MKYAIYYCGKKIKESESLDYLFAWLISEGVVLEDRRGTRWLINDYEIKEEEWDLIGVCLLFVLPLFLLCL